MSDKLINRIKMPYSDSYKYSFEGEREFEDTKSVILTPCGKLICLNREGDLHIWDAKSMRKIAKRTN